MAEENRNEAWFSTQRCYCCERAAGPNALQQANTYALVCPRCRRINRVRVNLAATVRILIFAAVMGEIQIWNALVEVLYRHVFLKLPAGILRQEIPLAVLVSIIGLSVWGLIKAARVIEGRQPPLPYWSEEDFQDLELGVSYTITPPVRGHPARISFTIPEWALRMREKDSNTRKIDPAKAAGPADLRQSKIRTALAAIVLHLTFWLGR